MNEKQDWVHKINLCLKAKGNLFYKLKRSLPQKVKEPLLITFNSPNTLKCYIKNINSSLL